MVTAGDGKLMKITYVEKSFRPASLALINLCNDIIEDYAAQGFLLTLRQLYYRLVAGDYIENNQRQYKRVGSILNDARLAGLVDWSAIEDRTRTMRGNSHWTDPVSILKSARRAFMLDRWEGQTYRPEVWIEKDALVGVIANVCENLDVPYFSCRGYSSQSAMWRAGERFSQHFMNDQIPFVIHLGDHDPSGMDMTHDIGKRLELFCPGTQVERIALNWDQVAQYDPPPSFAKITDSRTPDYVVEYGDESWELDALEPRVIVELIRETVLDRRDEDVYKKVLEREEEMLEVLDDAVDFAKTASEDYDWSI